MTIAKLRNLSKYGVITDVDPYNLPPEAFSMAVNLRFKKGSVEPAPVFRRLALTLAQSAPRYLTTNYPTSGFDTVLTGYKGGRLYSYSSGVETDISISGYANSDSDEQFTSCRLGDVFYVNRPDRVPWSLTVTDSVFTSLSNWDSGWRAKILRSCNSSLCAFGITKSATAFPTMVKTSQPATVNTVPGSWDETDPTVNAYENTIAEMEGGITEALPLGQSMIVYGARGTWVMTPTASSDIWDVRPLFTEEGCIGVNCVAEVNSRHFVFGATDIWMHDGVSKQSICDEQTRKSIFNSLNLQQAGQFFVKYDAARKEIRFNYVASGSLVHFNSDTGCNRSAVYYIPESTWTFDDLPYVFAAATANVDSVGLTYLSAGSVTYAEIGGSYLDQEDGLKRSLLMIGEASTTYNLSASIYVLDEAGADSQIALPVDTNATAPRTLERDGIDLDELPEVEKLEGYKVVSTVWPQARLEASAQPLLFSFGAANNYNDTPGFTDPQSYDGTSTTRCDFNDGGRYFFMRMTHADNRWFRLTGFDLDIYENGER